jgi:hypothetical protein
MHFKRGKGEDLDFERRKNSKDLIWRRIEDRIIEIDYE